MEGTLTATIKAAKGDGPGEWEGVLSMPTLDRDGEIVDAKAFDPLPDHIMIDVDHSMNVAGTVGSGEPYYDGDVLKIRGKFANTPLAQEVRSLVVDGHLRHMSVAYMNAKYETDDDTGIPHLRKGELLNAAIVGIPANREAAITAAKALAKVGARNSGADSERMQGAHDLMVELGAVCAKAHDPEHTKSTDPEPPAAAEQAAAGAPADVGATATARARASAAEAAVLLI